MSLNMLPILVSDSYKQFHHPMYPQNMSKLYSNMTPRSSRLPTKQAVWFGLQYYLKEYLIKQWNELFFDVPIDEVLAEYKRFHKFFSGRDVSVDHIISLHSLGFMPLAIKALPEGVQVAVKVPFYTITNTHPEHGWLVNFLETQMSTVIWDITTVATISYQYRKLLSTYALDTTGSVEGVQWQAHDFAMRGRSSIETSMNQIGHLLSFTGTDTIPAVLAAEKYYNANIETELVGASVPATEHSVMTSYGRESEIEAFERLLKLFNDGILSVVADSYDLYSAIVECARRLYDLIMGRNGKLVFRPDSGDPIKIITGWNNSELYFIGLDAYKHEDMEEVGGDRRILPREGKKPISEAERKGVVQLLYELFGGTVNELGYKLLDPHVGVIYGDSITIDRAREICERLKQKGFASTNWVAGIGSYTFNYNTRDTLGIAVKSTYCEISHPITDLALLNGDLWGTVQSGERVHLEIPGETLTEENVQDLVIFEVEEREIFKDPITDDGTKKSAKGLLRVDKVDGAYVLRDQVTHEEEEGGELQLVFEDGELIVDHTLAEIRGRIDTSINDYLDAYVLL